MSDILSKIKEQFLSKKNTIKSMIHELETKKAALQNQLESEFDNQVESELAELDYDENIIKEINSQMMEIQGRIDAYKRQLDKHTLTNQDKEDILNEAAEEYKKTAIQNLKNDLRKFELDKKIRELMNEAKEITDMKDSSIYQQLKYSELFPGMDEHELKHEVTLMADLSNNNEYIELIERLKPLRDKRSIYDHFTWEH